MQDKYKKLYEHFIDKLIEKLGSKKEAETVFGAMGLPVILESTKKILDQIKDEEVGKKVGWLLSNGREVEAFEIIYSLGIDVDRIMQDVFLDIFTETLKVTK